MKYSVNDCEVLNFAIHRDPQRGNLSVIQHQKDIPFDIKRVYYLYDVPAGESRGAHAHKELWQLMIAVSGAFRVTLDDGNEKKSFYLNRPYQGLLVKPGIWRDLDEFSSGACCFVLASEDYDENDYIRDYDEFLTFRKL